MKAKEAHSKRLMGRYNKGFILSASVKILENELGELPKDEVYKVMGLAGGISSLSFVKWVANNEVIEELTASTLRIGEKHFNYLAQLAQSGQMKKAKFFVSTMMADIDAKQKGQKYNYAKRFNECASKHNWEVITINNHSKIILMKTDKGNYYVLETSANLNENPKIEQFSFSNDKALYEYYTEFFDLLESNALYDRQGNRIR